MEKYILEIPNFIPVGLCDSIVKRFENDNRKVEGSFTYPVGDQNVTRMKNNTELSITPCVGWEDVSGLFLDYTSKAYGTYLKHLSDTFSGYGDPKYPIYEREITSDQNILCTGFPIQRIGKGDLYDWHHDFDIFGSRFIQIIFYLNTLQENQGGCTEFIDGRKVRPEAGKVLIYPCSWILPHKGCEVEYGHKYICTTAVIISNKFARD